MLLCPRLKDIRIVGYYAGKIVVGIGLLMLIPLVLALVFHEPDPALDFAVGIAVCILAGFSLTVVCYTRQEPSWMHGMTVVSLGWLLAMLAGAVPLYLSGHYLSFLDACFESMSGFATCGLTLVQQLDHMSLSHNMWRHLIMYVGGQGIVVVALTFFLRGTSGAFRMYVGEARDEKILPNVIETARFIWLVSVVYLILGAAALAIAALRLGISPRPAVLHGIWIFMAAWDTGGFAPQTQNILYYHSWLFETITIFIMILGSLNFKLHYAVWSGNRKEIVRNIEIVTFVITLTALFVLTAVGLARSGVFPDAVSLFRRGFYHLVSGHSGTGFMTVYARQFINEWSGTAMLALTVAMGLGGCICSTSGGIKLLRVGVFCKAIAEDVRRLILPDSALVIQKFHHIRDLILEDKQARSAAITIVAFVCLYLLGTFAGLLAGYSLEESMFESTSAAADVGLSCGITQAAMPAFLKVIYIVEMWAGRLEFVSVFGLAGFIVALLRGK